MANFFDQYDTGTGGNYFDQYDEAKPAPAPVEEPSTTDTVIDAVKGNLDIPFGILGGALGAYGGPAGVVAGGGAGTAVGSALSDYLETGKVNLNDVSTDAATSVVFDVGTMGAFKVAKPILTKLGFKPDEIMDVVAQKFGRKPSPKAPVGPLDQKTGSPESLLSTQNLLRAEGGSLAAFQTGKAGVARRVADGIGSIGVLSSQVYKGMADKNSAIIGKKLESLMNDGLLEATDDVGMLVHGIVQGGKEAAGTLYNKGMDDVTAMAGKKVIPAVPIRQTLIKFRDEGAREFGSIYSKETLNQVDGLISGLDQVPSMSVSSLIDYQKKLNNTIKELGNFGATQNTVASSELAKLSSAIRDTTENLLKNTDAKAYDTYKATNKAYGEALEGILPKLNAGFIANADKGNYESIASLFTRVSPDQISKMMNSIDVAYGTAKTAGVDMSQKVGLETADQVKDTIRNSYMRNVFGNVTSESFDANDFARKAYYYDNPRNAKAAKAVLGDKYVPFKRLLNAMAESTQKQQGFIGGLVLRSKESQAIQLLAGGGAAVASGPAAPMTAAAIFLGPVVLAKIASNPKAIDALLDLNKKSMGPAYGASVAATSDLVERGIGSIIDQFMTEEDKAEIRADITSPYRSPVN